MCILSKSSIFRVFFPCHWNHKTTQYKAQSLLWFLFYWFPFFQYQKIPISELCLSSLKLSISLKIGLQSWIYKCTYSIYSITLSVLVIHAAGGVKSCVIMLTLSREGEKNVHWNKMCCCLEVFISFGNGYAAVATWWCWCLNPSPSDQ